jgi:hypothetical protein
MRSSAKKEGMPRTPSGPRKRAAKSIVLNECDLSATVIAADQPRPQILIALGPEHRVVSFGAFLTFCLDALEVCRPSLPAQTGLLLEPQERRALARDNG